jgi:DNA-binding MarR family transcriptional regulator
MQPDPEIVELAGSLRVSVGLLVRRARQAQATGELTLPETSALARLDRGGPITAAALAKLEQISPQSMGATLGALEARGLVERRPDPDDGRQMLVSPSKAGLAVLGNRRNGRTLQFARGLSNGFTRAEIEQLKAAVPLIERLAETI